MNEKTTDWLDEACSPSAPFSGWYYWLDADEEEEEDEEGSS